MAYDFFTNQDDRDQAAGTTTQGAAKPLGNQSPVVTGNAGTAAGQPTSSGSFTNLQNYLDANADQQFGQQVAGKVGATVDEANTAQDQAKSGFNSDVDKNTTKENKDLLETEKNDPLSVANNQDQYDQFTKQRDATYSGPKDFVSSDYYQPAYASTKKASDTADSTTTESGRKAYLSQEYARPDYSSGLQKLDNLLIQNDPNSKQAFADVQGRAQQSQGNFSGLQAALDQYAQQGGAQTAQTRQDYRNQLGIDENGNQNGSGQLGDFQSQINSNLSKRQGDLSAEQQQWSGLSGDKNLSSLSPQQLQQLGIDPSKFNGTNLSFGNPAIQGINSPNGYLFGVNPGQYQSFTPKDALNTSNTATTEDLARAQALSKLANVNQGFIGDPSQVGSKASGSFMSYDPNALSTNVGSKEASYQRDMQRVIDAYNNAIHPAPGTSGIVNPRDYQLYVNDIRARYGLDRVGNESGGKYYKGGYQA